MSSAYSTEFAQKLERAYFLQRIKIAHEKMQREEQRRQDYFRKHFCENNPSGHEFQHYSPFNGCAKMVCVFCAEEARDKIFRNSVYAYKGSTFVKRRKTKKT